MSTNYKSEYKSLAYAIYFELKSLRESLKRLEEEKEEYHSDGLVGLYTGMISERKQTIELLDRWERATRKVRE